MVHTAQFRSFSYNTLSQIQPSVVPSWWYTGSIMFCAPFTEDLVTASFWAARGRDTYEKKGQPIFCADLFLEKANWVWLCQMHITCNAWSWYYFNKLNVFMCSPFACQFVVENSLMYLHFTSRLDNETWLVADIHPKLDTAKYAFHVVDNGEAQSCWLGDARQRLSSEMCENIQ